MKICFRVVGAFLLLNGSVSLVSLLLVDPDLIRSPIMVGIRYTLMVAAGLGFLLLQKWGPVIFFGSVLINWVAYFTVYDGQGSLVPLWMTIPVPLAVGALTYFGRDTLRGSAAEDS